MWETGEYQKKPGKFDFIEMSYQLLKTIKHRDRGKDSYAKVERGVLKRWRSLPLYAEDAEVTCTRVGMSSC